MRKWWRDSRWVSFWRDVGVLVMAMALFTVPLAVGFNFVCGGWMMQTEKLVVEAREVFEAVKGINESYSYVAQNSKLRDEYMDKRMYGQDAKLDALLDNMDHLSKDMRQLIEGQSAP